MASENTAPSAVTNNPPEVAPGIPAVEVDPTNELLDGENLDEKRALLEDEKANVQVDPSGRRLEHKDAAAAREAGEEPNLVIPPPASANLELRKRTEKLVDGMYESIGVGEEGEDSTVGALRSEREGLQRRADDGDEKAQRRLGQVDEQLASRGAAATERKAATESSADPDAGKKAAPAGRSSKPKSQA